MKKGFSIAGVIVGIVAVVLLGIATFFIIDSNNKAVKYDDYDFNTIIEPNADNGEIGDHIKGDQDAEVIIFEYADYQCPLCATINPRVNQLIEDFDGKLAVVHRSFLLSYHQNGTAAASAAEAAGLQGYWKAYTDELFTNQSEWEYASASERTDYFVNYFETVTGGTGDVEQFKSDLASSRVSRKISFDMGIGKRIPVPGTPAFYIDGTYIDFGNTEGGEITINGTTITWTSQQTGEDFNTLMTRIVNAKLGI